MPNDDFAGGEEIPLPAGDAGWDDGAEIEAPSGPKECEGLNCLEKFIPTYWKQRRCKRCRKNKVPYRDPNSPF